MSLPGHEPAGGSAPVAVFVFGIKPSRIGGIEVHTRQVAARLAERGWRVVLCFHNEPPDEVRAYLSAPYVTWEVLPNSWQISRQVFGDLDGILRRHRPALLHLQFTPFLSPYPWLARWRGVRRIVFTDHGSHPEGFQAHPAPWWKRLAGRILTQPLTFTVCVSEYNRRVFGTFGTIAPSRLKRIYNGADLERAAAEGGSGEQFRRRHGIPSGRILVVQVSWIIPDKGVPDVLEAARLALAQEPNLHFAFVGEGKYREEYTRRAIEMGIGEHVTWTGLSRDPMGEGVFAAADISCQASRWEEAFGLVIAEGMAFGKPFVATRVGGIPEVVLDGETGYLTAKGDTAALAERIVQLARDPSLRHKLGQAGRAYAQREFDVRRNAQALVDLYLA